MREFETSNMVVLPRVRGHELLALARMLVAIAQQVAGLPEHVREALADMTGLIAPLAAALAPVAVKRSDVREADRAEDKIVGAILDFLSAWAALPQDLFPQAQGAQECLDVLLEGKGREFLTFKPVVEHSEVERRFETLKARKLDKVIRDLGGAAFLKHFDKVHAAYGVATGATVVVQEGESAAVRERATELNDAMKTYVLRVVATVSARRPETRDRADMLLRPLREWESSRAANDASDEPVVDSDPAQDDAPAAPRKVG